MTNRGKPRSTIPPPSGNGQRPIGRLRLCYHTVGSTNDLARDLARAGYPHGTMVVADYQTAGRGRQGRAWQAPPGTALLCSTVLRPALPAERAALLTMAAALAAADALTAVSGATARLKWPNDVLLPGPNAAVASGDRPGPTLGKVAGLLLETMLAGPTVTAAVLGIGINLSVHPPEVATATDIRAATGRSVTRAAMLEALVVALQRQMARVTRGEYAPIFAGWRARLVTLGQLVTVTSSAGSFTALAEDVAADGALLVRATGGALHRLMAGEVTLSSEGPAAQAAPEALSATKSAGAD